MPTIQFYIETAEDVALAQRVMARLAGVYSDTPPATVAPTRRRRSTVADLAKADPVAAYAALTGGDVSALAGSAVAEDVSSGATDPIAETVAEIKTTVAEALAPAVLVEQPAANRDDLLAKVREIARCLRRQPLLPNHARRLPLPHLPATPGRS